MPLISLYSSPASAQMELTAREMLHCCNNTTSTQKVDKYILSGDHWHSVCVSSAASDGHRQRSHIQFPPLPPFCPIPAYQAMVQTPMLQAGSCNTIKTKTFFEHGQQSLWISSAVPSLPPSMLSYS